MPSDKALPTKADGGISRNIEKT